jgi:DNA-binding Xre family transcriptional regulator
LSLLKRFQNILEDIEDIVDLELEPPEGPYVPMKVVHREADGSSSIAAWREFRGLTQKELAQKIGISNAQVAKWEKPSARARKTNLAKIAQALECDPSLLEHD